VEPRVVQILITSKDPDATAAIAASYDGVSDKPTLEFVPSAADAMSRLAKMDYDAVLVDATLPEVTTPGFLENFHRLRPDTPLVLLIETGDEPLAREALHDGVYGALSKPLDPRLVMISLRRAVELRALRRWMAAQQTIVEHRTTAVQEELAAQLADVSRLHELSARLSIGLDLKRVLEEVLAGVTALQAADKGMLCFYDEQRQELYPVASIGFNDDYFTALGRIPLGRGACGVAAAERRRIVVRDVEGSQKIEPNREMARLACYRAIYSTALLARSGALIGTLSTYFNDPHEPSNRELRLVELYLRQAVEVIDNARLHRATQDATARAERYAAQLRGVTQAAMALNSSGSLEDTLQIVTERARTIIGAHHAATSLVRNDNWIDAIHAISESDKYAGGPAGIARPDDAGIYALASRENRPVRLTKAEREPHGCLVVPLIGRDGRNIGVVELSDKEEGDFTEQDEAILVQLAQMASANLENARLYAEAEAAEHRVTFLAEAGSVLARSLDFEITLRNIAQLVVPHLADWCFVDLIDDDGLLERMAVAHADRSKFGVAQKLRERRPHLSPDGELGSAKVLRTGWPEMFHEMSDSLLSALARDQRDQEILKGLALQSCICAPLQARGRALGVMTFLTAESGRQYGSEDLTLVREVARRAALAVDHAAVYQQAQEAIRRKDESLALLDTLLGTAPIGFAFLDQDLRFLRINDSLAMMNGIPREEHLGRTIQEVLPHLAPVLEPIFGRVLKSGEPIVNQELQGETPAMPGLPRDWLVSSYPVTVPNGQMLGVGVVVTEITDRKRVEQQIKVSLKEKEVLLKEIHHRVKNNLQIISSLLRLQSDNPQDKQPLEILQESQNRIRSMALIHEKLYQSHDLSKIDFTEYIRSLASSLFASYRIDSDSVQLKVQAEHLLLEVDAAIPCGLILNELITNALKYAFPAGRRGEIRIDLRSNYDKVSFSVADDGVGFPKALDFRNAPSLGLQLVTTLVDQLGGTIRFSTAHGTEFAISFPSSSETVRAHRGS
jgi:PAS domain S-box-containing protein